MNPEQQQGQTQPAALWTRPFIALTASFFLLFLGLQMLLSSFPAYVKGEFDTGNVQVSLVTSVFALAAIASRFATAALMRRVSRMALLLIGLLIAAAATGLYTAASSFGALLVLRIAYGIGFGMASTILPTLVSRIIPIRRMGEGIGYFGLSTSLAMSIGPSIGLNVMKHSGFMELTMLGLIASVLIFPVLWLSRSKHSHASPAAPTSAQQQKQPPAARNTAAPAKSGFNRKLIFPVLLNTLLSITYSGLLSFLALFGDYVHIEQIGLFFLFNAVTIILIRPFSGRIFDRKGHMAVLIPAGLCVTASMLLLSGTHAMPMLILSALLYGLGFGAIQPTIQAWMLRSSSPEQYGIVNSMFYNSTDFGVAIGALLLGAISAASNYSIMYRYSAGCMALFVILLALQAVLTTNRRRTKQAALES
ncbi:MFS transporter [Paenibacillus albus]|uniref:MFS transporter n=2 Tax=Paenibacillus albus TaxID=2495582 RepID=A0A3S9ACU3_9BACL|nr:MFS transporter [Paenibacillus albus]